MCWQYLNLGPDVDDVADAADRLRVMCDGYGLDDRGDVIDMILWWQDRCWRGIVAGAIAGDAAMSTLREAGVVRSVRGAWQWVHDHKLALESGLR